MMERAMTVARMERSEIRGFSLSPDRPAPDFASLHPGYIVCSVE